jgi:acetyl-CoA C-acetyltransferase
MGDAKMVDSMIVDGLWDVYNQYHMGVTAENVAKEYAVTREEQDEFAVASQNKTEAAQKAGRFRDEIVPLEIAVAQGTHPVRRRRISAPWSDARCDEGAQAGFRQGRHGHRGQRIRNQRRRGGGGADVRQERRRKLGLKPIARIRAFASAGVDPRYMGMGPVPASKRCLARAGWEPKDLDLMEINEAFAAQAIAVNRQMGWDTKKVNVNGGAIALGHPIGASGCRILVTLLHEMQKRDAKKGLASLCIGGGMGVALAVER